MLVKKIPAVLTFCLLTFHILVAQTAPPKFASQEELSEQLKAAPCKNDDRFEAAKALFKSMGAADEDISVSKFDDVQDLVIMKKGKTAQTIVVGAHYDKVHDGCGAIDNWTGIVAIANIYRTFRSIDSEKTYLFVAFGKEEAGLIGSHAMSKAIPKESRTNYCSMVNIDSFGLSNPQVLDNASTPKMREEAEVLAKELKIGFGHAIVAGADADSSSFKAVGIPAITFHGLNNNWQRYLHTSNDQFKNINMMSVFNGYVFVLRYLGRIDGLGCQIFKK